MGGAKHCVILLVHVSFSCCTNVLESKMDSKKKGKKKKKVRKPSQSSTTSTAVKSITPTAV